MDESSAKRGFSFTSLLYDEGPAGYTHISYPRTVSLLFGANRNKADGRAKEMWKLMRRRRARILCLEITGP